MGGYQWPVPATDWVTCSWQCHKDRNPPSGEPGTDIGCSYGSLIVSPEAGVVTYVKRDNSGGMGRTVQVLLFDGNETRPMHMSEVWVDEGDWIGRGHHLGLSGASGYGDDWYYGPHNHQTLWDGPAWSGPTIDFALHVGNDPEKGFLMALSDEQQAELYNNVAGNRALLVDIHAALLDPRPEYYDGQYNALQILLSVCTQSFDLDGDTHNRVRGPKPDVDMLQDILRNVQHLIELK